MTEEQFWEIVDESRRVRKPHEGFEANQELQLEGLETALQRLTPEELIQFDKCFCELLDRSYRWDLWAVAYLIQSGCSDDGFEYFRRWLISQGRSFFYLALNDSESIAETVSEAEVDYGLDFEEYRYVVGEVYKEKTGQEMGFEGASRPIGTEPAGERWTEEDLRTRFPRTWARFGWEDEEG